MTRAALIVAVLAAACSEHGKTPDGGIGIDSEPFPFPDAPFADAKFPPIDAPPGSNQGFAEPSQIISAWTEPSPGTFQAAMLDLSCLQVARTDAATTGSVLLGAAVTDFQSGNFQAGAGVVAFGGTNQSAQLATGTTDSSGVAALSIPAGTKRIGYKVTAASALPTIMYDTILAPGQGQHEIVLQSLSNATAATLPALIGITASTNTTIELGTITDCQGHTLANTIATVSSVAGSVVQLGAVDTYYFSESVGLPVRHSQAAASTKDGLFMILEVPQTASAFIQIWGFRTASDQSSHTLTLIAELAVPVPAASALFTRHDPHATH